MDLANWSTILIMVLLQAAQALVVFTKRGKDVERIDKEMEALRQSFEKLRAERKEDFNSITGKLDTQGGHLTEIRVSMARIEGRNEVRSQKEV